MSTAAAVKPFNFTRGALAFLLASTLMLGLAPQGEALSRQTTEMVSVIVQSFGGTEEARAAVEATGGRVTVELPIVNGVTAEVPADKVSLLERQPAIRHVSPNGRVGFHGAWEDPKIKHRVQKIVGSHRLWDEGVDGRDVTVALLDTGVYAEHPDLAGRVVHCEDFSHERNTAAHCADTFGHGTFMAGLMAGNGAASNGKYTGTAPKVNLVSVKAAGFDGSTDVSTILAGIQWVVAHRETFDIRALNLSLGSDSSQDYRLSPLNYAVERAWQEGIVVVVSAGNSGPDARTVMKPGDDPFVITVGASNDQGTMNVGDDTVPVFSSRGPTRANGFAKPDVVAPGVHTVSLRSPGSAVDQQFGSTAVVDGEYFRGTGTSMSTATTTGVVAQILQANPSLTPDQVKHRLASTARGIKEGDPHAAGAGSVDAYGAARSASLEAANQNIDASSGLGLLQADRGSIGVDVVTPLGSIMLTGEFVAQTNPENISLTNPLGITPWVATKWKTEGWDATSWDATKWKTDDWAATKWKADGWLATKWKTTEWDATKWKGTDWVNSDWDATKWKGIDWDATKWKATKWKSHWYAAAWD